MKKEKSGEQICRKKERGREEREGWGRSVSDPYSSNPDPDPDPAKNLNPDPDPDPGRN